LNTPQKGVTLPVTLPVAPSSGHDALNEVRHLDADSLDITGLWTENSKMSSNSPLTVSGVVSFASKFRHALLGPVPSVSATDPRCREEIWFPQASRKGIRLRVAIRGKWSWLMRIAAPCVPKIFRVSRLGKMLEEDPSELQWTDEQGGTPFGMKTLYPTEKGRLLFDLCGTVEGVPGFDIISKKRSHAGDHHFGEGGLYTLDLWLYVPVPFRSRLLSVSVLVDKNEWRGIRIISLQSKIDLGLSR
jgi:hypothetical protein